MVGSFIVVKAEEKGRRGPGRRGQGGLTGQRAKGVHADQSTHPQTSETGDETVCLATVKERESRASPWLVYGPGRAEQSRERLAVGARSVRAEGEGGELSRELKLIRPSAPPRMVPRCLPPKRDLRAVRLRASRVSARPRSIKRLELESWTVGRPDLHMCIREWCLSRGNRSC